MIEPVTLGGPARRVNALVLVALTLAALAPATGPRLAALALAWLAPGTAPDLANSDFVNYWMAGRLAIAGDVSLLFDPPAYYAALQAMFGADYPPHNWSYPPHAILLFWPLGLLSFKAALAAFLAATLAFYLWSAQAFRTRFAPDCDAALFWTAHLAFIAVNAAATQNGFLTGGLILVFLARSDSRPWLAGLCLGLLTIKPQLGLLAPLALLFAARWRATAWAVVFTVLFVGASVLAFGIAGWRAYLEVVVPYQHFVMTNWEGAMLLMMPTIASGLRQIGVDASTALAFQAGFSLLCAPLALLALWKSRNDGFLQATAFVFASFLVAPYSFNYDMGAVTTVCAILLARSGAQPASHRIFAALVCLLPVTVVFFAAAKAPLAPLMLLGGLVVFALPRRILPAGK